MLSLRSKRPWKKFAEIRRVEHNNGDVKFLPYRQESKQGEGSMLYRHEKPSLWNFGSFESLTEAEADLDAWWADWWPKQIKSTRRA